MFYDAAVDLTQRDVAVCESAIVFGQFMDDIDVRIGCESIGLEADEGNKKSIFGRLRELLAKIGHAIATFMKRLFSTQVYAGAADAVTQEYSKLVKQAEAASEVASADSDNPEMDWERWTERQGLNGDGLSNKLSEAAEKTDAIIQKIKSSSSGTATKGIRTMKDYKAGINRLKDIVDKMYSKIDRLNLNVADGIDRRNPQDVASVYTKAVTLIHKIVAAYQSALQKCIYTSKRQDEHDYKSGSNKGQNKADVYQTKKMNKFMDN